MNNPMQDKEYIIESAQKQFFCYGIKSLSMDEIANHLGISKKTLYEVVGNKENLVELVIDDFVAQQKAAVNKINLHSKGQVQELIALTEYVFGLSKQVSDSMTYDLKKYYPKSWQRLFGFYNNFLFDKVKNNFERGAKAGLYHDSINPDFIAGLFLGTLRMLLRKETFTPALSSDYPYLKLLLTGMASKKGLQAFRKHLDIKAPSN